MWFIQLFHTSSPMQFVAVVENDFSEFILNLKFEACSRLQNAQSQYETGCKRKQSNIMHKALVVMLQLAKLFGKCSHTHPHLYACTYVSVLLENVYRATSGNYFQNAKMK